MPDEITFKTEVDLPPMAVSLGSTLFNKTGSWRYLRPNYENHLPPCNHRCPAGIDIQGFLHLAGQGKFIEAYELIKQDSPLPAVCGRVCYHPCESACNRGAYDEPLAIHALERFVADYALKSRWRERPVNAKRPEQVAVIGSGPAGLSAAYHLAKLGYPVTIFEADGEPGGMLRIGIPKYRLPRPVLDREIGAIEALGVKMVLGKRLGRDFGMDDLKDYAAVFLATGAHQEKKLGIPGDDVRGVISGVSFLREVNLGRKPDLGKRIAVIGGGNTAIDVSRCAIRLGVKPVILYRRSRQEMPAVREEIAEAEKEGVQILYLTTPTRIVIKSGKAVQVECLRMQLTEPDADGRRKPVPVKGSEFLVSVDTVVKAIGEDPDLSYLPADLKADGGMVTIDEFGATSRTGVFAGGDAATGAGRVVDAIGAGKRAARSIDRYLRHEEIASLDISRRVVMPENVNWDYFFREKGVILPQLHLAERVRSFTEVGLGLMADEAVAEANRCLSCGVCTKCDVCWLMCPDLAIAKVDTGYKIDYDYCKGCGICAAECPRNAMSLEEEAKWRS